MSAGYEGAPATLMLATHCAACARPLVDAVSVEAGMGPECRKKHGYGVPQGEPDWVAAAAVLAPVQVPITIGNGPGGWGHDAHKAANVLVHRIALEQEGPAAVAMVQAVHHLGFTTLAKRIGERLVRIEVALEGDTYVLRAPYSEVANQAWRGVPGRRWCPERKANTFPMRARAAFWRALQAAFPGEHALGPRGYFRIGGVL